MAQEHFVQLEYCLIVVGATLSSACSQRLNDGGEKRQSWSLLSRLSSSSLEFIPENCTSCIVMFLYGIKDLQLCICLFIYQAVVAYL